MTASASALLEARRVSKVFGAGLVHKTETVALKDFSFTISGETPSVTAIVGESGSGKSTVARLLVGLERPTTGTIEIAGQDISDHSRASQAHQRAHVQMVFRR